LIKNRQNSFSRIIEYIDEENINFWKYLKYLDKHKIDLFKYTRILIPILIKNKIEFSEFLDYRNNGIDKEKFHWALVSVNLKNMKMILYDSKYSFSDEGKAAMQTLAKFFDYYFEKKHRKNSTSTSKNSDKNTTYTTTTDTEFSESRFDSEDSSDDEDSAQNSTPATTNLTFNFEDEIYFNCRRALNFDELESNDREQEERKFSSKWRFKYANTPIQSYNNEPDSGVFVCKFMEYLTREEPILFCKDDAEYFRILMSIELIESKLFTG
jgi:Ulp1 family protease